MASTQVSSPGLITGQRMTREEFLCRWEALPDLKNAELIEGIVYVASPVSREHGIPDTLSHWWLMHYVLHTPGCEAGNHVTWMMLESAPQPDGYLMILPKYGGQARGDGKYWEGAPELAVEICVTSTEHDFGPKLALYQRAGVREYITFESLWKRIVWRVLVSGSYVQLSPDADGNFRSAAFPGLWLNPAAFWKGDGAALQFLLEQGLASAEHVAFVDQLKHARRA